MYSACLVCVFLLYVSITLIETSVHKTLMDKTSYGRNTLSLYIHILINKQDVGKFALNLKLTQG